jgi:hypothetical protein
MAKGMKVKRTKKQPKIVDAAFVDEKVTGVEPVWDTARALKMSETDFDHHLNRSLNYYNHYYTMKTLRKPIVKWLTANKKLTKPELALYLESDEWRTPITVGSLIKAHEKGMPLKPNAVKYIMEKVRGAVNATKSEKTVEKQANKTKLSIQDHLTIQLNGHIAHFEFMEDRVLAGEEVEPKAYDYLTKNNVPQALVGKIARVFKRRSEEVAEAKKGKDEQLNEGYAHYKPKKFRILLAFYAALLADLETYGRTKKVARKARVRKAPSKEKVVSRMKFKKDEPKLKLVSINPVDILSASSLWVYNVRTRKLGVYHAESTAGTLGVKGSTILGFDPALSVHKTLRKPEIQLNEFLKAGKVQQKKYLSGIRAVETALTGRINKDTVLLKVM